MDKIDNIELLMEETACERSEAEFALSLANGDIEKAIVKLGIIQKYIVVIKIKMFFFEDNFYGLLHIAINTKVNEILRFNIVFSQNPQIYGISAQTDWFSFEKGIFSARLKPGAMEIYTKKIEEPLKRYVKYMLTKMSKHPDEELILAFFNPLKLKIELVREQINTTQFKKLPDFDNKPPQRRQNNQKTKSFINLEVKVLEISKGKPIEKVKIGDNILTLITDQRDIAKYLTKLLTGRRKDGELEAVPATVTKIFAEADGYVLHFQYNDSIASYAKVSQGAFVAAVNFEDETSQNPSQTKVDFKKFF
ncbi:MAG: hypothetical protein LBB93_05600 [Elusimicrobiota bacterium]|jgi:5-hydroxyisourate hydrolase-like protein (transthyretin family)|nr:hypothetical protein [Elusimicrobiota bacterium]